MNFHSAIAPKPQCPFDKQPRQNTPRGDCFPIKITPQFIDRRIDIEEADGGGSIIRLGLSKADQSRLGAMRVELVRDEDDPAIELHQQLALNITGHYLDDWGFMKPTILETHADILPFTPKTYTKIDGILANDCRALEKRFGKNFAEVIAATKDLSATRFSPEKRASIVKACEREATAAAKDAGTGAKIIKALCVCAIAIAERGYKAVEIVQKSAIYTACSRARNQLTVIGDVEGFIQANLTPEIERNTLFPELLTKSRFKRVLSLADKGRVRG